MSVVKKETKQNIPKDWYADIINLAASKTKIPTDQSIILKDNGLNFIFNCKEDAEEFEDNIGKYIIKSIKKYMNDHNINRSLYLMNLLFTTSRNNLVVNIYW